MTNRVEELLPIPMVLFCPKCGLQHIDAPDVRTPDWNNPPHRSHLCHGCGCIWRPADVPTEGVIATQTRGSKDTIFYNRAAVTAISPDGVEERLSACIDAIMAAEGRLAEASGDHPDVGSCAIRAIIDVERGNLKRSRQHIMSAHAAISAEGDE